MPRAHSIAFLASDTQEAQVALARLTGRYGQTELEDARTVVALGGDGFMLQTLHATQTLDAPVYGMNRGTVGFLMNDYRETGLTARLARAEEAVVHPLRMSATRSNGEVVEALAINEVSLLRAGPQAARLRISVDGKVRMEELVCDGALLATPAGSTAYNYSAHGPILPIGSGVLALTAMSAFRPRRWRGALLPQGREGPLRRAACGEAADDGGGRRAVGARRGGRRDRERPLRRAPSAVRSGARAGGAAAARAVHVNDVPQRMLQTV